MTVLLRMQDREGRGPFRPGFSWRWNDDDGPPRPPAVQEEIGLRRFMALANKAHRRGLHIGCACSPEQFDQWFTTNERFRLAHLGYQIHDASSCKIIAELGSQVIIASKLPFASLPLVQCAAAELQPAEART